MRLLRVFSHRERCFLSSLLGGEEGGSTVEGLRAMDEFRNAGTDSKWKMGFGGWIETPLGSRSSKHGRRNLEPEAGFRCASRQITRLMPSEPPRVLVADASLPNR